MADELYNRLPDSYYALLARTRTLGTLPSSMAHFRTADGFGDSHLLRERVCDVLHGRSVQFHGDSTLRHLYMSFVGSMRFLEMYGDATAAEANHLYDRILMLSRQAVITARAQGSPWKHLRIGDRSLNIDPLIGFISDNFNECDPRLGCRYDASIRCPRGGQIWVATRANTLPIIPWAKKDGILVIGGSGLHTLHMLPTVAVNKSCYLWHGVRHEQETVEYVEEVLQMTRRWNMTVVFRTTNVVCQERFNGLFAEAIHSLATRPGRDACANAMSGYLREIASGGNTSSCACGSTPGWIRTAHGPGPCAVASREPDDVLELDCMRHSMTDVGSTAMAAAERRALSTLWAKLHPHDRPRLRLLDAAKLGGGPGYCNYTRDADGRHFPALDALQIRALVDLL